MISCYFGDKWGKNGNSSLCGLPSLSDIVLNDVRYFGLGNFTMVFCIPYIILNVVKENEIYIFSSRSCDHDMELAMTNVA